MNRVEAVQLLSFFQDELGLGYHCDTPISDYVNADNGEPIFSEEEVERLQPLHDDMMRTLGNEAYDLAWAVAYNMLQAANSGGGR